MGTLAAGIKDIFSTAKTTGTNVMLSANDGTPVGNITMADLASVLGIPVNSNLISITKVWNSTSIGAPAGNDTGLMLTFMYATSNTADVYISTVSGNAFVRKTSSSTVGDWSKVSYDIPDFYKSYSNLSALSSALNTESRESSFAITTSKTAGWKDLNIPANLGSFLIVITTYYESCIISVQRSSGVAVKVGGTTSSYQAAWKASESDSITSAEVYCFTYTNNKWRIFLGISGNDMTYNVHVLY